MSVTEHEGEGIILFLINRVLSMWLSCLFKATKLSFIGVKTDMHGEHVAEEKVKQTMSPVTINHSITTTVLMAIRQQF